MCRLTIPLKITFFFWWVWGGIGGREWGEGEGRGSERRRGRKRRGGKEEGEGKGSERRGEEEKRVGGVGGVGCVAEVVTSS